MISSLRWEKGGDGEGKGREVRRKRGGGEEEMRRRGGRINIEG